MHQELLFTLKFNIPSIITQPIHLLGWKLKEEEGRGCRSQRRRRERRKKKRHTESFLQFISIHINQIRKQAVYRGSVQGQMSRVQVPTDY